MRSPGRDAAAAVAAAAVVVVGVVEARRGELHPLEVRAFRAVNRLSHRARLPVWAFMQLGSAGGALAVGAVVAGTGRPALGRRLAVVGTTSWAASKVVKPFARRGRPAAVLEARVLGRPQRGLGYPSGHAAVGAAMAAASASHVGPAARPVLWAGAVAVGGTRSYVGAHLPLDLVGGVALGIAIERAVRALRGPA